MSKTCVATWRIIVAASNERSAEKILARVEEALKQPLVQLQENASRSVAYWKTDGEFVATGTTRHHGQSVGDVFLACYATACTLAHRWVMSAPVDSAAGLEVSMTAGAEFRLSGLAFISCDMVCVEKL